MLHLHNEQFTIMKSIIFSPTQVIHATSIFFFPDIIPDWVPGLTNCISICSNSLILNINCLCFHSKCFSNLSDSKRIFFLDFEHSKINKDSLSCLWSQKYLWCRFWACSILVETLNWIAWCQSNFWTGNWSEISRSTINCFKKTKSSSSNIFSFWSSIVNLFLIF